MKTNLLIILFFLIIGSSIAQTPSDTITNEKIIELTRSGISPKVIIGKIHSDFRKFDLSQEGMKKLEQNKVDEEVINEMLLNSESINDDLIKQYHESTKVEKKYYTGFSFGMDLGMCKNGNLLIKDVESHMLINFDQKPLVGLNFGLLYGRKIKKWLELQVEINYLNKGMSYMSNGAFIGDSNIFNFYHNSDIHIRQNIFINYIQTPVLIKFVSKPGLYLSIGIGNEIAIYSTIRSVVKVGDSTGKSTSKSLSSSLNSVNSGLLIGGGFQKKWFGIEVRYSYDFFDSYKIGYDNHHLKNQVVQFSLYLYLGKKSVRQQSPVIQ